MANDHPKSENLKPLGDGRRTKKEERTIQSKGGKKSGESRRRKRDMKNAAKALLSMKISPQQTTMKAVLKSFGISEDDADYQMAVLVGQLLKAGNGDTQAATFLRDTAGENPNVQIREKELAQRRKELKMQQDSEHSESTLADAIENAYRERVEKEDEGDEK